MPMLLLQPNSARYWRCNEIAALTCTYVNERQAVDPEQLARIRADENRLKILLSTEQRIKARYQRMRKGAL